MALQDYVFLTPDDPTRRGWRGLLRRVGLYRPAPDADTARRRRWQLAPRLAKRLEVAWRRTRRVAVVAALLLAFHAQKLIGDQGHATVTNVRGQAGVILQGGPELPMQEQVTLSGDEQPVLITRMGMVALQLSDSRLRLDPHSRVQVGQMTYWGGGAVRHFQVLEGRVEVEVNPQDVAGGHYDVECNGIQVRALPTNGSPESNEANKSGDINGSVVFALTAKPNGVQVQVARGQVRIYSSPSKRFVRAGSQLAATQGKPLPKPTAMDAATLKSLLAQHRTDGDKSGLIASALASIGHLYMGTQEKMFMPSLNTTLAVLHLRPGNPLEEASRNIVARTALDALGKAVSSMQELPEKINYKTLAELDLDRGRDARTCFKLWTDTACWRTVPGQQFVYYSGPHGQRGEDPDEDKRRHGDGDSRRQRGSRLRRSQYAVGVSTLRLSFASGRNYSRPLASFPPRSLARPEPPRRRRDFRRKTVYTITIFR